MHLSDCDIRTLYTISYKPPGPPYYCPDTFYHKQRCSAAPKSYYEYDSQQQINASEA